MIPRPTFARPVAQQPVSTEATARAFGDFLVRVSRENASQLADLVVAQVQAGLRKEVQK